MATRTRTCSTILVAGATRLTCLRQLVLNLQTDVIAGAAQHVDDVVMVHGRRADAVHRQDVVPLLQYVTPSNSANRVRTHEWTYDDIVSNKLIM